MATPAARPIGPRPSRRPLAHSPLPTLAIPQPPRPRPRTPNLILSIPSDPVSNQSSYFGGPNESASDNTAAPADVETIVPPSSSASSTAMPPPSKSSEPLADIRAMLAELELTSNDSASSATLSPATASATAWADGILEEIERLGEGAGGAVHKVRDKRTNRIMARKTITTREAPMKQLLRELLIISSTVHPNVTTFYGAYMSPSTSEVKILMEYCEGGSLEAIGKRIKEKEAIVGEKIAGRLAEGILQGLAYLHQKKTIHRDIKPSNILLSRDGIVKLCDFGVSGELVNSLAGTFTGTSFYMAPERITGHEYTIRSDVWSTGISLLELVQNRFPYPSELGPIDLMMHISSSEPPRLEDEPGIQWSENMKDFIRQTLIVDANTRPTPKDMLEHLWIAEVMKQEVHMARWIRQVWGWPKPQRRSRDSNSISRPTTSADRPSSSAGSSDGSPGGSQPSADSSPHKVA